MDGRGRRGRGGRCGIGTATATATATFTATPDGTIGGGGFTKDSAEVFNQSREPPPRRDNHRRIAVTSRLCQQRTCPATARGGAHTRDTTRATAPRDADDVPCAVHTPHRRRAVQDGASRDGHRGTERSSAGMAGGHEKMQAVHVTAKGSTADEGEREEGRRMEINYISNRTAGLRGRQGKHRDACATHEERHTLCRLDLEHVKPP